jgi:hypothetical protein
MSINSKIPTNSTPSLEKNKIGYIFIPLSLIFFSLVISDGVIISKFA